MGGEGEIPRYQEFVCLFLEPLCLDKFQTYVSTYPLASNGVIADF